MKTLTDKPIKFWHSKNYPYTDWYLYSDMNIHIYCGSSYHSSSNLISSINFWLKNGYIDMVKAIIKAKKTFQVTEE